MDNISCTQVETVEITQPLPININTTITDASCFGVSDGSIDVATSLGTALYDFIWSNGSTTESISAIAGNVYFVTVTDDAGCVRTSGGSVINPPELTVSITNVNATCGQSNGTLFATANGGTPSYDYTWSTGGSSIILANIGNGNYTVTVEDANNCLVTATSLISSTAPSITTTNTASLTCAGNNDAIANSTITDAVAPISYLWSNAQTGSSATGLSVGVYILTVTDGEGCILSGTTTVTHHQLLVLVLLLHLLRVMVLVMVSPRLQLLEVLQAIRRFGIMDQLVQRLQDLVEEITTSPLQMPTAVHLLLLSR